MKHTPGPKILDCKIPIAMDRLEAFVSPNQVTQTMLTDLNRISLLNFLSLTKLQKYIHHPSLQGLLIVRKQIPQEKTSAPKRDQLKSNFLDPEPKHPTHDLRSVSEDGNRGELTNTTVTVVVCHDLPQLGKRNTFYTSRI